MRLSVITFLVFSIIAARANEGHTEHEKHLRGPLLVPKPHEDPLLSPDLGDGWERPPATKPRPPVAAAGAPAKGKGEAFVVPDRRGGWERPPATKPRPPQPSGHMTHRAPATPGPPAAAITPVTGETVKEKQLDLRHGVTQAKSKTSPAHAGTLRGPPTPPPPSAAPQSKDYGRHRAHGNKDERRHQNWANLLKTKPAAPPPTAKAPPKREHSAKKGDVKRRTTAPGRRLDATIGMEDDRRKDGVTPRLASRGTAATAAGTRMDAKHISNRKGRHSFSEVVAEQKQLKAGGKGKHSRRKPSLRKHMKKIQASLRKVKSDDDDDSAIGDDVAPDKLSRAQAFRYPKATTDGKGSVAFTRERAINRGEFEDKVKALAAKFRKKTKSSRSGVNAAEGRRGGKRTRRANGEQRGSAGKRTSTYKPYEPED